MSNKQLEFEWPDLGIVVRADMLDEENPEISQKVWNELPMESNMGHVVISGETMWFPTRIVHLGKKRMVTREIGDVYFFASGQSICMTYGTITESAKVNKFAQVREEGIELIKKVGKHVLQSTVNEAQRKSVRVIIRRVEEGGNNNE